jgi:hypothetical protein
MKISITLVDDNGRTFQGEAVLTVSSSAKTATRKVHQKPTTVESVTFSMPIRAFVKKYGRQLSGPERFTILVAYFCKGQVGKPVLNAEIEKHWNKMKPLLGGKKLNSAHSTRAKEHGWIDSPSRGKYVLCVGWKGALHA